MTKNTLIIMPFYNEEDMNEKVIDYWPKLELEIPFKILFLNVGSNDSLSNTINKKIASKKNKLLLINQVNSGNETAILTSYKYAIQNAYKYTTLGFISLLITICIFIFFIGYKKTNHTNFEYIIFINF